MFDELLRNPVEWAKKNYMVVVGVVVVLVLLVVVLPMMLSHKSPFQVSNDLNWGASPYLEFVRDNSAEKYSWNEVTKPNLDVLVPEYNYKLGVVEYQFGDTVYDRDSAQVDDTPMPVLTAAQLHGASNALMVANNVPPPPSVSSVLVPASQAAVPPVIMSANSNPPVAMVPVKGPGELVNVAVPAAAAAAPPVIMSAPSHFGNYYF